MHWFRAKIFLLLIFIYWLYLIITKPWIIPITIYSAFTESKDFKKYTLNLWLSDDQSVNAFLGGNPDVTISDKVGRMSNKNLQHEGVRQSKTAAAMEIVINKIFELAVGEIDHCINSYEESETHYNYLFKK